VSFDVASARAPISLRALPHVAALPARWVLAALVAISFCVRWALATGQKTPLIFPDEYLYSELARGFAVAGRPLVRGEPVSFPALLEPLLAAPTWLAGDPLVAYRLTQGLHALVMSLAAVPIYLLARQLGLGKRFALGAAAVGVASPDLLYASFVMSEPVAYPLVLAAVAAGTAALARPSPRAQLIFLAFAGLAAFARIQFAFLPLALLAAAVVVERGRLRAVARRQALVAIVPGAFAALAFALAPETILGPYAAVADARPDVAGLAHWAGLNAMLLVYAAGWVLVPGAIVGLWCGLSRHSPREERAFCALTTVLVVALLAETGLIADFDAERFEERYLFALFPLITLAFGLWARREERRKLAVFALAAGLFVPAVLVPLSGYAGRLGKVDSPFLWAVSRLELAAGPGNAALAVSLAAAALSAAAVGLTRAREWTAPLGLGLILVVFGVLSAGAFSRVSNISELMREQRLPADPGWIDRAELADVALLQTPGGSRTGAAQQLFWNRSVEDVLVLGRAEAPDSLGSTPVRIDDDGRLRERSGVVRRPVLVETFAATFDFAGARLIGRSGSFELWRPAKELRVSLLAAGRYHDGWLAGGGSIFVWPDQSGRTEGTLRLELSLPPRAVADPVRLLGPGVDRTITLRPGESRLLTFPVSVCGRWELRFATERPSFLPDLRAVSVRAEAPSFARTNGRRELCAAPENATHTA
jgi:hypothetical protein